MSASPRRGGGMVGLLLAAGSARRFGRDKLREPLPGGGSVAQSAAARLRAALPECLAVVRHDTPLAEQLEALGLRSLRLPPGPQGLGHSLAAGVAAAPAATGWVVALADMPFIEPATIAAVAAAITGGAVLAAPFHAGRRGHPVGFAAALAPQLLALTGDQGARALLARHPVTPVRVVDPGILIDIDHPSDLPRG